MNEEEIEKIKKAHVEIMRWELNQYILSENSDW